MRIVVYLKRDADPHFVLNQLYALSPLQKTVSIILLALVDGRPRYLPVKEMIEQFLRHRVKVIRRRTEYLAREAKRRGHVLEGQLIAISSLDEVIRICREAPSREEAKHTLQGLPVSAAVLGRALGEEHFAALQREIGVQTEYRMTEAQAEAVVRMQLGQLARLQRDEIIKEYNELREKIVGYERLLTSDGAILAVVRADLIEMRDKYGDDRRTEITGEVGRVNMEDLIEEEDNAVTISHNGYIKRLPLNTYRAQHRGGKGVSGGAARDDDFIEHFFVCLDARLLALLHQHRPHLLAQGLRHPVAGPHVHRPGHRQRAVAARGREDHQPRAGAPLRGRPLPHHGDAPRRDEEDAVGGLQPAEAGRHHRHQPGRRRRADRRGPDAAGRRGAAVYAARHGDPLRRSPGAGDGPQHARRPRHRPARRRRGGGHGGGRPGGLSC